MRDSQLVVANGQTFTDLDGTGEIADDYLDLEKDSAANSILTDDQVETWCNIVLTSYSYTSGGGEGLTFSVRTDDNVDHATAKSGSAGYIAIGSIEIPLEDLATGMKISFRVSKDIMKRYMTGWAAATSTPIVGTIIADIEFSDQRISENESLQKVTA